MKYVITEDVSNLNCIQTKMSRGSLLNVNIDITARCNNNCRHCYINIPPGDLLAKSVELSLDDISQIADQAVEMGAIWFRLSGGEPLLRPDFEDIYLSLKHKGLLVSIYTNATLITDRLAKLFNKYPPRDIEITVYGATRETYERVTRLPSSYDLFIRGLNYLTQNFVKFRLKAMAINCNVNEIDQISAFCRERTKDYYRFDPVLNLRFDGDPKRNEEIISERLTSDNITSVEANDSERMLALNNLCKQISQTDFNLDSDHGLFHCGIGRGSVDIDPDGQVRLCSSLRSPGMSLDLRQTSLKDAVQILTSRVLSARSDNPRYQASCQKCKLIDLCSWCPANAYLETGSLEGETPYFCQVAHARAAMIRNME